MKAVVAHDHQNLARFLGRLPHFQRFLHADRVRLLAENMQPRVQRVHRDNGMQVIGRADIHRVQPLGLQQLLIVGENRGLAAQHLRRLLGPLLDDVADRDNLHVVHILVGGDMGPFGDAAVADDANVQLFHSRISPFQSERIICL